MRPAWCRTREDCGDTGESLNSEENAENAVISEIKSFERKRMTNQVSQGGSSRSRTGFKYELKKIMSSLQDTFTIETVSRYFHIVLHALGTFSTEMIKPPSCDEIRPAIVRNTKHHLWLKTIMVQSMECI